MSNEIARNIVEQLGNGTLAMLGARNLLAGERDLTFKIMGSKKATHIKIALAADDTYTVTFMKVRSLNVTTVAEETMVYVDSLHKTIEAHTGLYTRL
jgi:hypothetical protein